ncbi:6012_t:CDS:2 [Entrophospora sp. SA101]|nr:6012_t:CDS:2 [Entrophospora sp. SA101]
MSDSQQQKNVAKIEPNISGIFITCVKNKEALCVRECYDLFNEYAGKLFLSQAINATDPAANKNVGDGNDDNLDIEDVIAKELSEMKRPHSSNNFASIQTGTDCVVFIKTNPPIDPTNLVYNILDDLNNSGEKKTRFSRRLIPITQTCYANTNDIQNMAQLILNPIFNNSQQSLDPKQKFQYAIVPNTRNNDKVDKKELINMIAKIVGEDHTVNLE